LKNGVAFPQKKSNRKVRRGIGAPTLLKGITDQADRAGRNKRRNEPLWDSSKKGLNWESSYRNGIEKKKEPPKKVGKKDGKERGLLQKFV